MSTRPPLAVLHLCAGNLYGGIERVVAECARSRMLCPGMAPSFAVCFDGRLAAELAGAGNEAAQIGPVRAGWPPSVWRARRRLRRLIAGCRPDVVLCHSSWIYAIAAPVIRAARCGLVVWMHDRVSGKTWVERWAGRTTPDAVVTNSRFTDDSVALMYPRARREIVRNPVRPIAADAGTRARVRASLGVDDRTVVVVLASRMQEWKGHRALLQAAADLRGNFQIWIAGGAQRPKELRYERSLKDLAAAADIRKRVRFLGHRDDVDALLLAADIHCQPNSGPEPFGVAFVEALSAGLPVVTTSLGGAREIVTSRCGVLVPPGNIPALRAALEQLVEDAGERRRLGSAGPARAMELCDPARQLAHLADVLAEVRDRRVMAGA